MLVTEELKGYAGNCLASARCLDSALGIVQEPETHAKVALALGVSVAAGRGLVAGRGGLLIV